VPGNCFRYISQLIDTGMTRLNSLGECLNPVQSSAFAEFDVHFSACVSFFIISFFVKQLN